YGCQGLETAFSSLFLSFHEPDASGLVAGLRTRQTSQELKLSSRSLLRGRCVLRPGGRLVVEGAGFEAAVQDADEPVGELAQGGVVAGAAGALVVVVGACPGGGPEGGEGLGHEGVDEPVVVDVPG